VRSAFRKLRKAVAAAMFVLATALFVLAAFTDGDAIDQI
jgi:hypothetical protein